MFPSVPQVHIEADSYHDAALVVVDTSPMRYLAIVLVSTSGLEDLGARYLKTFIQIVDRVKYWIGIRNLDDGAIREYPAHTGDKCLPLLFSVKVITHEEQIGRASCRERG